MFPTFVDIFPSSFNASTVIETDVAVSTAPMNIADGKDIPGLKMYIIPAPIPRGTTTPSNATTKPTSPDSFSSSMFVSIPAVNMITITPSSAILESRGEGIRQNCTPKKCCVNAPSTAGPKNNPAINAPTTWGSCARRERMLKIFVDMRITQRLNR